MTKRALKRMVREGALDTAQFDDGKVRRLHANDHHGQSHRDRPEARTGRARRAEVLSR